MAAKHIRMIEYKTDKTQRIIHMKHKRTQRGVGAIAIVATIVIVLLAGAVGWYMLAHADNNQKSSKSSANKTVQSAADPTQGGKYLVIKEWGVRFKLNDALKDDLYANTANSPLGNSLAIFGSKKLDGMVSDNACAYHLNEDGTTTGGLSTVLSRINFNQPNQYSVDYYKSQFNHIAEISSYDYSLSKETSKPSCSSSSSDEAIKLEREISGQLRLSLSNLEYVKN